MPNWIAEDSLEITKRMHLLLMQKLFGGCCPRWIDGNFPTVNCWCYRDRGTGPALDCPKNTEIWVKPDYITAEDYAKS